MVTGLGVEAWAQNTALKDELLASATLEIADMVENGDEERAWALEVHEDFTAQQVKPYVPPPQPTPF